MKLHIDIETRSTVELTKVGVYAYAEHDTTEITMLAYAFGDDEPAIWYPPLHTRPAGGPGWTPPDAPARGTWGASIPDDLRAAMADPSVLLSAHNAGFERIVMNDEAGRRLGIPHTPLERWDCTAGRAANMGLPRSLEGASAALGLAAEKDAEGSKLMRLMMRPRKPTKKDPRTWVDDDATILRVGEYCRQDVRVEQAIDRKLPPLRAEERETWLLTEQMNDRGVLVDTDLLTATMMLVDEAEDAVMHEVRRRTGCVCGTGFLKKPLPECSAVHGMHHSYVTKWLAKLGIDDQVRNEEGKVSVSKAAVQVLLERTDLDPLVRGILILRQENGGTASKKYMAMLKRMSRDSRIRGAMVFCGAASTGRWSSRGVQLQNLLRMILLAKPDRLQQAIRDVMAGVGHDLIHELYGPPLVIAGELLRPTLIASPGTHLVRGDSSQIEARVLPWLAGAEWKLNKFRAYDRKEGPDLYIVAATGIYQVPDGEIDKDDPRRQIGKVSELALGFEGGARALQSMAKAYRMKIPVCPKLEQDEEPPDGTDEWIKRMWRAANPEIASRDPNAPGFWRRINQAAIDCMRAGPGPWFPVGASGLAFRRNSEVLVMRLPSGRLLWYWTPRLVQRHTPWGTLQDAVVYRSEDSVTHQWREFQAYGGLWTENAVQATARELMAYWLRLMKAEGIIPVLSVHDEGIGEADCARWPMPDQAVAVIEQIMKTLPPWAAGLPVNADASAGPRYVKS
jgi:DNA polymerase